MGYKSVSKTFFPNFFDVQYYKAVKFLKTVIQGIGHFCDLLSALNSAKKFLFNDELKLKHLKV